MLSFSLVAEALTGLIYHRPSGENSNFQFTLCQMMGEVSSDKTKLFFQNIQNQDGGSLQIGVDREVLDCTS